MRALSRLTRAPQRAALLLTTAALAAGLTGTAAVTTAAAATSPRTAAGTCTFSNPITAKTATVGKIRIELRYSTSTRCAWGRITNAHPDDLVWTERSYTKDHKSWEVLDKTEVKSGTDTHTASRYDGGVWMRACAWDGSHTQATNCTGWY
ncbi:DUF2690 domain-containing protein [Streptomyces sp. NPDC021356]|uniref:DUF2690 domain-containing protein n=1 Tax=Streptomyces sp. NPDC021356 TaxID=3154900 RepID=UPI0033C6E5D3